MITSSGLSDIGLLRNENQDTRAHGASGGWELFIVADGMGGEAGGRFASELAAATLIEALAFVDRPHMEAEFLESSIKEANRRIYSKGKAGDPEYKKMGTTIVTMLIDDTKVFVAHVGDSRAYLYRNGKLNQVTKDHSLVQQMVDGGIITREEAMYHPNSNIITRSLGSSSDVMVDILEMQALNADVFLLCTDGLSGLVLFDEIEQVLATDDTLEAKTELLVKKAKDAGGKDNITVQLVAYNYKPYGGTNNNNTTVKESGFLSGFLGKLFGNINRK